MGLAGCWARSQTIRPMKWFYARMGVQLGPVSLDELTAKIAAGEVRPDDLVWREDFHDWRPLKQVEELAPHAPAGTAAAGHAAAERSAVPASSQSGGPDPVTHVVPRVFCPSPVRVLAALGFGVAACAGRVCRPFSHTEYAMIACGILAMVLAHGARPRTSSLPPWAARPCRLVRIVAWLAGLTGFCLGVLAVLAAFGIRIPWPAL